MSLSYEKMRHIQHKQRARVVRRKDLCAAETNGDLGGDSEFVALERAVLCAGRSSKDPHSVRETQKFRLDNDPWA